MCFLVFTLHILWGLLLFDLWFSLRFFVIIVIKSLIAEFCCWVFVFVYVSLFFRVLCIIFWSWSIAWSWFLGLLQLTLLSICIVFRYLLNFSSWVLISLQIFCLYEAIICFRMLLYNFEKCFWFYWINK